MPQSGGNLNTILANHTDTLAVHAMCRRRKEELESQGPVTGSDVIMEEMCRAGARSAPSHPSHVPRPVLHKASHHVQRGIRKSFG